MKKSNVNITAVPLSFCDPQCYTAAYELHILMSCEAYRYSSYFIDLKSQITWGVFDFCFLLLFFWLSFICCKIK